MKICHFSTKKDLTRARIIVDITINVWYNIKLEDNAIEVKSIFEEPNLFLCPPSIWTKIFKREFILKNNISFLKQRFDEEDIPYSQLSYSQHQQRRQQQNNKENKHE